MLWKSASGLIRSGRSLPDVRLGLHCAGRVAQCCLGKIKQIGIVALVCSLASPCVVVASSQQAQSSGRGLPPDVELAFRINAPKRLFVQSQFRGGPEGFTVLGLCINKWLGMVRCDSNVKNLKVKELSTGKELVLEHPEPNVWIFDNAPGEKVSLEYELQFATSPSSQAYESRAMEESITFFGNTGILLPEHLVNSPSCRFRYTWSGEIPQNWRPVSSFAVNATSYEVSLPAVRFLSSIFSIGKYREEELQRPSKAPIHAIWINGHLGDDEANETLRVLSSVETAIERSQEEIQGIFWFFMPLKNSQVTAVSLTSSIVVFVPLDFSDKAPRSARAANLQTIAHELVHHTNAGRILLSGSPGPANLIPEGAAEFLGRRALLRAGLINRQECLQILSGKVANYSAGTNSADAPENLGDLFLLMLDSEIRQHSQGKKDVIALLGSMIALAQRKQGMIMLSWSQFADMVRPLTSPDFFARVQGMVSGQTAFVPPRDLESACAVSPDAPLRSFGFGVNSAGSRQAQQSSR